MEQNRAKDGAVCMRASQIEAVLTPVEACRTSTATATLRTTHVPPSHCSGELRCGATVRYKAETETGRFVYQYLPPVWGVVQGRE